MSGKPKNTTGSVTLTLTTTPQIKELLETIAETGLQGKNPSEVAERIVGARIVEMIKKRDPLLNYRLDDSTSGPAQPRAGPD